MADIQELAITFLESLSHNVLRFNPKRETLDARIIEGPYHGGYFYKECIGIFPGPSELSVLERCP